MPAVIPVAAEMTQWIDRRTAERYSVIPLRCNGHVLLVAMADSGDAEAIADLTQRTRLRVRAVPASAANIRQAIDVLYLPAAATPEPAHLPLGRLMVAHGLMTTEQLEQALKVAAQSGEKLGKIAVSLGYVNRLALSQVLAEQAGLPHVNLRENRPAVEVARLLSPDIARRLQAVPVRWLDNQLLVAIADPSNDSAQARLRAQLAAPLTFAVASELDVEWVLEHAFRANDIEESVAGLLYRNPDESARETFTDGQVFAGLIACLITLIGLALAPEMTLVAVNAGLSIFYLAVSGYKLWLSYRGASNRLAIPQSQEELRQFDDHELPTVTILCPMYREKEVLPDLVRCLESLDYPKSKLDVKLLLEEDDHDTLEVALRLKPPSYIKFVMVPNSQPRTKPKACNYGLLSAEGQLVVIFDADDRPDRDQLRHVAAAFRKAGPGLMCVQAKLNYYNREQNLLTRWFTAEYSNWFDLILPGLASSRAPIPLGGTSNYFYTEKLRDLGGWDPFNVTEDADLGVRMAKRGYHTAVVDSTTFEEANSQIPNWIRQRSRWLKGYMQTWLVHMRNPRRLLKSLGWRDFLSFQLTIGGTPLMALLNPVWWLLTLLWMLGYLHLIQFLFPRPVYTIALFNLVAGNFAFVYLYVLGLTERRYYELTRAAMLSPLYWALMSIAAWKGLWQLLTRPFYWEKTQHGLPAARAAGLAPAAHPLNPTESSVD